MIYFYQDAGGLFHIDNDILPAGKYILKKFAIDTKVSVVSTDTQKQVMGAIEIINLTKENDTNYTGLTDLLTGVGDFFK